MTFSEDDLTHLNNALLLSDDQLTGNGEREDILCVHDPMKGSSKKEASCGREGGYPAPWVRERFSRDKVVLPLSREVHVESSLSSCPRRMSLLESPNNLLGLQMHREGPQS